MRQKENDLFLILTYIIAGSLKESSPVYQQNVDSNMDHFD